MKFGSVDEILTFATDREKEAVEFYASLAKQATRASLKETFESFSKEEQKHVDLLSDISSNREKIDAYEFKTITDSSVVLFR